MSHKNDDFLIHYGIPGQKWGVRRYQNEDGTLTEEGRKRYYDSETSSAISKKNDILLKNAESYLPEVKKDYDRALDNFNKWKSVSPEERYKRTKEKYKKLQSDLDKNGLESEYAMKFKDTYWYINANSDQERLDGVKQYFNADKTIDLKYSNPKMAKQREEEFKRELSWLKSDVKAIEGKISDMKKIKETFNKYGSIPYSDMAEILRESDEDDLLYYLFHYHFNEG